MTHGWPGSVVEFLDVIGPLTDPARTAATPADAFHVVCPSLPGLRVQRQADRAGLGRRRGSPTPGPRSWPRLGYDRYGAQGGDWGSAVTTALGAAYPDRVVGHPPQHAPIVGPTGRRRRPDRPSSRRWPTWRAPEWGTATRCEQATRPQTLGYGLVDSPVGQCAWIAEKYWAWTDHDGDPTSALSPRPDARQRQRVLAHRPPPRRRPASTGRAGSPARPRGRDRRPADAVAVPAAISIFPREIIRPSRRWCERRYTDLRFYERAGPRRPLRGVGATRAVRRPGAARVPHDALSGVAVAPRVSLVTLGVRDVAVSEAFYRALGWEVVIAADDGFRLFRTSGAYLTLWPAESLWADAGVPPPAEPRFGGVVARDEPRQPRRRRRGAGDGGGGGRDRLEAGELLGLGHVPRTRRRPGRARVGDRVQP